MTELINEIKKQMPELELRENEPMSRNCSFKIGGQAKAVAVPASIQELKALLDILREAQVIPLIIGNGTNLLVTDEPLERFVIKLGDNLSAVEKRGDTQVYAEAGVSLARLAAFCAGESLTGLEFAHGIPGTLGGAASMNAGAYGGEMKDVLRSVSFIDTDGVLKEKQGSEMELSYRHSVFSDTDCIIVGCTLELAPGNETEIREKMRELGEKRRKSQPLDKPSAGSTFKRPKTCYAAALIDEAGLKGYKIGGAQVSEKHAGFVINTGDAGFDDVVSLIAHIKKTVMEKSGVELEPEIKIIINK